MRLTAEITTLRKGGDSWHGIGFLVDEQSNQRSNIRITAILEDSQEQLVRNSVLQGQPRRVEIKEEFILEMGVE